MKFLKICFVFLFLLPINNIQAEVYAVIVGVSKYKDSSNDLRYAAIDALKFHNLLTNGKQNPNIVLLLNEKATLSNIRKAISETYGHAKSTDHIIFYFSGHGLDGFFCQYDADGKIENFLKHAEIQSAFKSSKAKVKMCIADACHAGSIKDASPSKSITNFFRGYEDKSTTKKDNIIVFMSSRDYQYSSENSSLGQGVFTYYLIESFQGKADTNKDKKVTAKEMYTYVRNKVHSNTRNEQTPVMFGQFSENTVIVSYK